MEWKYIDINKIDERSFSIIQIKEIIKALEYLRGNINTVPKYWLNPWENIQLHNLYYFLFWWDYRKYKGKWKIKVIDVSECRITQDDIVSNYIHWHIYRFWDYPEYILVWDYPEYILGRLDALWMSYVNKIIRLEWTYKVADEFDKHLLLSTNNLDTKKYYQNLLKPIWMV